MKEQSTQNEILAEMGKNNIYALRINSGQFWGGNIIAHDGKRLVLENPTKIMGAPAGTSDIILCKTIFITPQMVGQKIGQFGCLEVKIPGQIAKKHQDNYLMMMRSRGAITGVVRSPEDMIRIVNG